MKIKGLQKTTVLDYPGKIACTVFLFGCNFRCGFCHNPELVLKDDGEEISEKEFFDFLEARRGQLEGVCITGGEPLLTMDKEFLEKIKELGYFIKLDTNGYLPEKLEELISEGLVDFIAMDIKNCPEKYSLTAGVEINIKKIEKSIKLVHDFGKYEFRTTVVPSLHNEEDFEKLGEWMNSICLDKPKKFCLQGFRNGGKFLDKSFSKNPNILEKELADIESRIKKHFCEIEIRV